MAGMLIVIRIVPGPYPKFSALEALIGMVLYTLVVYTFSTPVIKMVNAVALFAIKRMYESTNEFIRSVLRLNK